MTALGTLLRLFPLVAAALLLTAQPLDLRSGAAAEQAVVGFEREGLHRSGDFVTRKQRHAASLEEFFAIDDDADQFSASAGHVITLAPTRAIRFSADRLQASYREPPPSHKPCAGLQTGPPTS